MPASTNRPADRVTRQRRLSNIECCTVVGQEEISEDKLTWAKNSSTTCSARFRLRLTFGPNKVSGSTSVSTDHRRRQLWPE